MGLLCCWYTVVVAEVVVVVEVEVVVVFVVFVFVEVVVVETVLKAKTSMDLERRSVEFSLHPCITETTIQADTSRHSQITPIMLIKGKPREENHTYHVYTNCQAVLTQFYW